MKEFNWRVCLSRLSKLTTEILISTLGLGRVQKAQRIASVKENSAFRSLRMGLVL